MINFNFPVEDIEQHHVAGKTWYVYHDELAIWFFEDKELLASCYATRNGITTAPSGWVQEALDARCTKKYLRLHRVLAQPSTPVVVRDIPIAITAKLLSVKQLPFHQDGTKLWLEHTPFFFQEGEGILYFQATTLNSKPGLGLTLRKILFQLERDV